MSFTDLSSRREVIVVSMHNNYVLREHVTDTPTGVFHKYVIGKNR